VNRRLKSITHFIAATLAKVISAVIVIKFLAWQLGPDGFGLISQLMALTAIASMLAGGGVTNGVIKTLSVTPSHTPEGRAWLSNALFITSLFSVVIACVLLVGAPFLAARLLEGKFVAALVCLAIAQCLAGVGSLILAEASSRGDSSTYALINSGAALLGAAAIALGTFLNAVNGAAYAIAIAPAFTGMLGLVLLIRKESPLSLTVPRYDRAKVRSLMSLSSLTLTGALSVPIAQILIRDSMGDTFSWESVGYWQGAVKISDVYMQFVGVILINYALPRFSNADLVHALAEFRSTLLLLFALLISGFAFLLIVQDFVINLVFSSAFLPMGQYFLPQMGGDLFRTFAAASSFFLLARGQIKIPLAFELFQGVFIFGLYRFLEQTAGKMGPAYAHFITYLLLAGLMGYAVRRYCNSHR
jgi:O-antigen/teichoic acid export membrane protein